MHMRHGMCGRSAASLLLATRIGGRAKYARIDYVARLLVTARTHAPAHHAYCTRTRAHSPKGQSLVCRVHLTVFAIHVIDDGGVVVSDNCRSAHHICARMSSTSVLVGGKRRTRLSVMQRLVTAGHLFVSAQPVHRCYVHRLCHAVASCARAVH